MPQGKHSTIQIELASAINQVGKPQKLACAGVTLHIWRRFNSTRYRCFEWQHIPLLLMAGLLISLKFPDWTIEILPQNSVPSVIRKISICLGDKASLACRSRR